MFGKRLWQWGPVVVLGVVLLALLVADLSIGKGNATEDIYLPTPVGTNTPGPPPTLGPTRTPMPSPTVTPPPPGADKRDAQRRKDVQDLMLALVKYRAAHGQYPSTNNNLQSLCKFKELDIGCKLEEFLNPLPSDPLNDDLKYGYWFQSDGKRVMVVHGLEQPQPSDNRCEVSPPDGEFSFYVCNQIVDQ